MEELKLLNDIDRNIEKVLDERYRSDWRLLCKEKYYWYKKMEKGEGLSLDRAEYVIGKMQEVQKKMDAVMELGMPIEFTLAMKKKREKRKKKRNSK